MFELIDTVPSNAVIKVIGVGGGGGNAVNHMYREGIHDVTFVLCNTDNQALAESPVPVKLQLGRSITQGLGAGNRPERARDAAEESIEDIRNQLNDGTKMVFITAGMGGGTGTGAAPVIARIAARISRSSATAQAKSGSCTAFSSGASSPSPSPVNSHMIDTFSRPATIDSLLARGSERSSSQAASVVRFTPSRRANWACVIPAASRAPATRSPKVALSGPYQSSLFSVIALLPAPVVSPMRPPFHAA